MKTSWLWLMQGIAVLGLTLGAAAPVQAAMNLVGNGSFGTGDFTDWSIPGDTSQFYVSGSGNSFAAALTTSSADGMLNQNLVTVSGQPYVFSFTLSGDGATPNTFSATLGGITKVSLADIPDTLGAPVVYTSNFTATSTASLLSFDVRDDPGYLYVTDVSVIAAAAPEPSTWVMLAGGFGLLAFRLIRTRRIA